MTVEWRCQCVPFSNRAVLWCIHATQWFTRHKCSLGAVGLRFPSPSYSSHPSAVCLYRLPVVDVSYKQNHALHALWWTTFFTELCFQEFLRPLLASALRSSFPNTVSLYVCRLLCTQASVRGRSGCFCPSAARRNTASRMCRESEITQSCPTLCGPVDYTVHGILEARIPVWVAFPFSSKSSQPRDRTQVSRVAGGFFTSWAVGESWEYLQTGFNLDERVSFTERLRGVGASCTLRYLPASAVPPFPGGLWTSAGLGAMPSTCSFCELTDGSRGHSHTTFVPILSLDHPKRVYSLSASTCCRCLKMAISSPPRIFLFFPYGSLRFRVFSPWPQINLVSFVPTSVVGFWQFRCCSDITLCSWISSQCSFCPSLSWSLSSNLDSVLCCVTNWFPRTLSSENPFSILPASWSSRGRSWTQIGPQPFALVLW